jgi:hypothetical protein
VPGISSLDTLFVDLGIDAASDGLQMYEATDLLLRRRPLQNDVPCIIWQVNAIAEPTYETDRRSADQFLPLQSYLLEFYPAQSSDYFGSIKNISAPGFDRRELPARDARDRSGARPAIG